MKLDKEKMMHPAIDEEQQFRLKLNAFLEKRVVPRLEKGQDVTINMDGNVFDALSTGPRFATNWVDVQRGLAMYSRSILFHLFGIRTFPANFPRDSCVKFPAVEPEDSPEMPSWEPLPS